MSAKHRKSHLAEAPMASRKRCAVSWAAWWSLAWCFCSLPNNAWPIRTSCRGLSSDETTIMQIINEVEDPQERKAGFESLLTTLMEKEKAEIEKEKVEIEKEKVEIEKQRDVLKERMEKVEGEKARLEGDLLRAKGLLTARSVFERVVQLAFNEQVAKGNTKGSKCVVANALPIIAQQPQVGRWSWQLFVSAKQCAGNSQTALEALTEAWNSLSSQIHNSAWGDVVVPEGVSNATQCIAGKLCQTMGLNVRA